MVKTATSDLTLSNIEGIINAIDAILSNDITVREQNEELLKKLKDSDFDGYVHAFTKLMKDTPKLTIRIFCMAHLRKVLPLYPIDEEEKGWADLRTETQKLLKETLMEFFKDDKYPNTQKLICDLVGDIASIVLTIGKEKKRLSKEATEWNELNQAIWNMLDSGNVSWIKNALMVLAIVVETAPEYFSKKDKQIIDMVKKIVKSDAEDRAKQLALECLIVVFQTYPKKFRKKATIIKEMAEVIFNYMVSTTEEPDAEWLNPSEELAVKQAGEELPSDPKTAFGLMIIDSIIQALDSTVAMTTFCQLLSEMMAVNDWRYKHCAIISFSQLGEHMDDISQFDIIIKPLIELLQHEHPKVRYAALHCIGQSAEDLRPQFQENYGKDVLAPILKVFNDNVPRVVCHAVNVIVNLMEGFPQYQALEYVPKLLESTISFLEKGNTFLKESALTAIGTIAELLEKSFIPYWEKTYSIVFNEFSKTPTHLPYLKGVSVETLSLILYAVGKEEALKVVGALIDKMIDIQNEEMEMEMKNNKWNVLADYIISTWSRIPLVLGDEFAQYIDKIAPSAFEFVSKALLEKKEEENKAVDDEHESAIVVKLTEENPQEIDHKVLEKNEEKLEVTHVVQMVSNFFSSGIKKNHVKYISEAFEMLMPFLRSEYNIDVNKEAADNIIMILDAITSASSEEIDKANILQTICSTCLPKTIESVKAEFDSEVITHYFRVMAEVIKKAGRCLTEIQINELADLIFETFKVSLETMLTEDEDDFKDEDEADDGEEDELEAAKFEIEEAFQTSAADLLEALFKVYQEQSLPIFKRACTDILPECFKADLPPAIPKMGLFIIDDAIEFLDIDWIKDQSSHFTQVLVKYTTDSNAKVRNAAVYGLGVLFEKYPDVSKELCEVFAKNFEDALLIPQGEDEVDEDFTYAQENITIALGKLIKAQPANIDLKKYIQVWMNNLSFEIDKKDGKSQYDQFVDMLLGPDAVFVTGENGENLEKVVEIIAEAIDTESVNGNFKEKAVQALEYLEGQETTKPLLYAAIGKLKLPLLLKLKAAKEAKTAELDD